MLQAQQPIPLCHAHHCHCIMPRRQALLPRWMAQHGGSAHGGRLVGSLQQGSRGEGREEGGGGRWEDEQHVWWCTSACLQASDRRAKLNSSSGPSRASPIAPRRHRHCTSAHRERKEEQCQVEGGGQRLDCGGGDRVAEEHEAACAQQDV